MASKPEGSTIGSEQVAVSYFIVGSVACHHVVRSPFPVWYSVWEAVQREGGWAS